MNRTVIQDIRSVSQDSKNKLRLWLRLLSTARRVEAELRERFRLQFETTLSRFDVMAALARHEDGLKMSALGGLLRVSNGNVTVVVQRLEKDGLLIRAPVAGDRRAMLVRLSEHGKTAFIEQAREHEKWITELLSEIPEEDATLIEQGLSNVASKTNINLADKEIK